MQISIRKYRSMKKTVTVVLIIFLSVNGFSQKNAIKSGGDRMKTFIDALMKKMTLDEKIGQLNLPGLG